MDSRQRSERLWSAQHRVARVLAHVESLEQGADEILGLVAEANGWKVGLLWDVTGPDTLELTKVWRGEHPDCRAATDSATDSATGSDTGVAGEAFAAAAPAWQIPLSGSDTALLARIAPGMEPNSSFAFPALADPAVLAVMSFFGDDRSPPDDLLLNTTRAIGSLIGQFASRREAEAALREREEHYRLALESAETGTWELDLASGREVWSDDLFRLYGLDPSSSEASYELWLMLVHPEDRKQLEAKTQVLLGEGQKSFIDEFRTIHPSKGVRWMLSRGRVDYDENGGALSMRGTIVDITNRKRVEEEIQRLNRELERRVRERTKELAASNAELESFAYSVSHDLRAPLRGIDGFSQALLEDYGHLLDERGHEYVSRVRSGARRMGELIDDLLDLSRLSRQELKRQRVDLSGLAHTVMAQLIEQEPERELKITIQPNVVCLGDAGLLRVVLENLLGNAWKFTRVRRDAEVEFGTTRNQAGVEYFVRDNGIGFDTRYENKLFGAFQRLHKGSDFEGSGIGLATVKRIIQRHDGRVRAEGAVDEGATFYFTVGDPREASV